MDATHLTIAKDAMTIVAALTAIVSLAVATKAYRATRKNQSESLVQRAYFDYAKMALEHPRFAYPINQDFNFSEQTLNSDGVEFERYEWFLSSMLATVHFILKVEDENEFWRQMMVNQIAYHWKYLKHFGRKKLYLDNWHREMEDIINEGIEKGEAGVRSKGHAHVVGNEHDAD
jgi:hypothetical protein